MLSNPGTEAREREVDQLLGALRERLVRGEWSRITIENGLEYVDGRDGWEDPQPNGSFMLHAEALSSPRQVISEHKEAKR
ncbi:hypothetical protein [Salipiger sp. PrR003]|uniref:hypothetical protein n=1 Tax=Salipiger sp. PrR003 TaxID=2706776 RepID=UPI0013DB1638|nr:hypothetical protein [Salipiger sp. PrR003]NDV53851.1 hypothetical protein [Salipiger sp. PrR003]